MLDVSTNSTCTSPHGSIIFFRVISYLFFSGIHGEIRLGHNQYTTYLLRTYIFFIKIQKNLFLNDHVCKWTQKIVCTHSTTVQIVVDLLVE